jgi:hypothetical protein
VSIGSLALQFMMFNDSGDDARIQCYFQREWRGYIHRA